MNPLRTKPAAVVAGTLVAVAAGTVLSAAAAGASTPPDSSAPVGGPADVLATQIVDVAAADHVDLDPACVSGVVATATPDALEFLQAELDVVAAMPQVSIPEFSMPEISMPDLGDLGVEVELPEMPSITIPEIDMPPVGALAALTSPLGSELIGCIAGSADAELVESALAAITSSEADGMDAACAEAILSTLPAEELEQIAADPTAVLTDMSLSSEAMLLAVCDLTAAPATTA